jgi:hypothetical protein
VNRSDKVRVHRVGELVMNLSVLMGGAIVLRDSDSRTVSRVARPATALVWGGDWSWASHFEEASVYKYTAVLLCR